jgi:hypothetical protein
VEGTRFEAYQESNLINSDEDRFIRLISRYSRLIWLLDEGLAETGDPGEAIYKYLSESPDPRFPFAETEQVSPRDNQADGFIGEESEKGFHASVRDAYRSHLGQSKEGGDGGAPGRYSDESRFAKALDDALPWALLRLAGRFLAANARAREATAEASRRAATEEVLRSRIAGLEALIERYKEAGTEIDWEF